MVAMLQSAAIEAGTLIIEAMRNYFAAAYDDSPVLKVERGAGRGGEAGVEVAICTVGHFERF